jgi:hypothetical protein
MPEYENDRKLDKILKQYTSSDDYRFYKGAINSYFSELVNAYPFDGGKIYRGLNFSSPKQYLEFRRSIRDGFLTTDNISSWGKDQVTGKQFAISPQVFVPTAAVLRDYDSSERVSGFIGIILVTNAEPGIGIDVSKSKSVVEPEVILPPGHYKIDDIIVEKKWKHIVSKIEINEEITRLIENGTEIDQKLMRALFKYKKDKLYDSTKKLIVHHAVDCFIKKNYINIEAKESLSIFTMHGEVKEIALLFPDGEYIFEIYGSLGFLDSFYMNDVKQYLSNEDQQRIRKHIVDKINKVTKVINNKACFIKYSNGFNHICEMFDISLPELKYLRQNYAANYNRFNLLLRDWNKQHHFNVDYMIDLLKSSMEGPFK